MRKSGLLGAWLFLGVITAGFGAETGRVPLNGHLPPRALRGVATGRLAAETNLSLAIGLPARNQAELDGLLRDLYDPHSGRFHRFLTPREFTENFGPTEEDYQAVIDFARTNGLTVTRRHGNRLVLEVEGSVSKIERAFEVNLRTYRHPTEGRDFYAPDGEPSIPGGLRATDVEGLTDFSRPRPQSHPVRVPGAVPLSGSGPDGLLAGGDFRNAYVPGVTLNGTGQSVGLLEFSAYYESDIVSYENSFGLPNVPLTNVVVSTGRHGGAPSTANSSEVSLDIELAISMAPGLSRVIVFEQASSNPSSILSTMADDDLAKQMSCSWTWTGGPSAAIDSIFKQMGTQGQSFFQASGDTDAYTGANALDNENLDDAPVDSPYVTAVGAVTLTMNGSGASWSSETVWNYNPFGGSDANEGSSGGVSSSYPSPTWQTNVSMASNNGSSQWRCVPDVALVGDDVWVIYGNGQSGGFAGTSCAAPAWAGFTALVNQQSVAFNGTTVGFLNPAIYAIATGPEYAACFHDTTAGNNIGTNTPGLYNAVSGYDLCTGWGTPSGSNLISALAPKNLPEITSQPVNQIDMAGSNAVLSVGALGAAPLTYQWEENGTALADGAGILGATSNVLTLTDLSSNSAGSYSVVVANSYGAVTSSVAVLTVVFPPTIVWSFGELVLPADGSCTAPMPDVTGTNFILATDVWSALSYSQTPTKGATLELGSNTVVISVMDSYGNDSYSTNTIVVADETPPQFGVQPQSQTNTVGTSASFSASATACTAISYQWIFNGAVLNEQTNSVLTLPSVTTASAGNYAVIASASGGATTSLVAVLTVNLASATVALGSSENPSGYLDSIVFSAQVTPANATGSVQFLTNGAVFDAEPLVAGVATSTNVTSLPRGTNLIAAVYSGDANNSPATNFLQQVVTNHPPTAAPAFYTRTAGSPLMIVIADLATNWSDVDGDTLTLAAVGVSTNGVTLVNTNGVLLYVNSNNVADEFIGTITDGWGGMCFETVRITVVAAEVSNIPQFLTVAANADGTVTLNFAGAPGDAYILEATTDLAAGNWEPIATNVVGTNGQWQYTDEQAPSYAQRFFQLVLAP
jgi:hypothetical protein